MTHTNQTVNSIGTGIRFQFAAAGDSYLVAPGVTVRSTNAGGIQGNFANNSIEVYGLVESLNAVAIYWTGTGGELIVGKQGTVSAVSTNSTSAVVFVSGASSTVTNLGRIVGETTIGVVMNGDIVNHGVVKAASGIFLGLLGRAEDSFENFGKVSANSFADSVNDDRLNNGVFSEGPDTLIVNHGKGKIFAISSEGAGVAIAGLGNGSEVVNAGAISSKHWYGVDFFNLVANASASIENSGKISGGMGSFRGNETSDFVTNRGVMKGDIVFNAGDDVLDGGKGKVIGNVFGGDGNDILRAGKGNQRINGGNNDDILDGGKGKDVLVGGAGSDTFVFSTGYGKDEVVDFVAGTDFINLSGWKAINDFDDVLNHAKKHGSDLWITAGKDILIIDSVSKSHLHEDSFIF